MTARIDKTMAVVRWLIVVLAGLLAAYSVYTHVLAPQDRHAHADRYYCPMHPQIRSPDPGECPICHMRLEPIPADRAVPQVHAEHDGGVSPSSLPPPRGVVPVMLSIDRVQTWNVTTTEVVRSDVAQTVRLPAVIEARTGASAEVRLRAAGFLERVLVTSTGTHVGRGQPLAYAYSPDIARTAAELGVARSIAAQTGTGDETGRSLEAASNESLVRLGVGHADVDALVRGEPYPIRATRSGVVTRMAAIAGSYASPETVLYEITDLSRIWATASVSERDLALLSRGVHARLDVDGEDAPRDVVLETIEPTIDPATRTARARFVLPNPEGTLLPGAVATVTLAGASTQALVVPSDAVIDTGTQRYVFVERGGGVYEPRSVTIGGSRAGVVELIDGLAEGERVVTRGGFLLDSESRLAAALESRDDAGVGHAGHAGHAP